MTFTGNGIYHIDHAHVSVRIALAYHSSKDGTAVIAWNLHDEFLDHLWLIQPVHGEANTYTIRNTVSGTYMDLTKSSSKNGTPIIGWHRTGNDNQKWIIKKETSRNRYWKIQNKASQTFIDLLNGKSADASDIVGWQGEWSDGVSLGHQLWDLKCQSVLGGSVLTALHKDPYIGKDFQSYLSDAMYLVLNRKQLQEIWPKTGLTSKDYRPEIFDCDDFAFAYKAEVAKWGKNAFKVDGFAILCGIMYGSNERGNVHAYNWMVDPRDHYQVIYFEPQDGTFKYNPGYKAFFGVF
ncbi:Moa, A lectin from the mushroom marasmius Oreades in complex with the trisaccharide Galgalglcnac [Cubamyces sp. BRFM 1775]|nr:Moa, A lectin from the mushroom marasmius Oreades in complex with the trisaccharide Galgalglcnac [Cubamyces sp. BRFM 1775]